MVQTSEKKHKCLFGFRMSCLSSFTFRRGTLCRVCQVRMFNRPGLSPIVFILKEIQVSNVISNLFDNSGKMEGALGRLGFASPVIYQATHSSYFPYIAVTAAITNKPFQIWKNFVFLLFSLFYKIFSRSFHLWTSMDKWKFMIIRRKMKKSGPIFRRLYISFF